jgi:drug/metabolite transporter (DMT)-like permease
VPASVLGYWVWYGTLRWLSPSTLSLSLYACPVIATISGVVVFDESLTALKVAGVALVLYALYLVNVKYKENNGV